MLQLADGSLAGLEAECPGEVLHGVEDDVPGGADYFGVDVGHVED